MPETHVSDSSFSTFRWEGLSAKSLNPFHQGIPTASAAVSSHIHHPEKHTSKPFPCHYFSPPAAPGTTAPHSSSLFSNILELGTTVSMTCLQAGACKLCEKRRAPFWIDFKLQPRGLMTDSVWGISQLVLKDLTEEVTSEIKTKVSFHATSETVHWESTSHGRPGDPNNSIAYGNCSCDHQQQRHWASHLGVTTGLQDGIQLECYLLPLLQHRAQRVCSSSKLKCLELETITDTFSPCGYLHFVPVSLSSW